MDWKKCPAVETVPGKVSGNWVFTGTRLPVYDFIEWFEGAEESEVRAVLEHVAQDLRDQATYAHPVR